MYSKKVNQLNFIGHDLYQKKVILKGMGIGCVTSMEPAKWLKVIASK
jgi:hypothetical protein